MYCCSGRATFSARVMELHKAPLWNMTPTLRMMRFRFCSSPPQKSSPLYRICPERGRSRPDRLRITVLLPQPLPPMMMKTSPRLTLKFRFCWIRKSP